jgi:hypothetical protein
MDSEKDETRDKAIKTEIRRLLKLNPNSIAVYIIINEPDESKLPDELPMYQCTYSACSLTKN